MSVATIVGAYALRPADPQEASVFDRALGQRHIDGLEISDQELAGDLEALAGRLGDWGCSVVTLIPGTMRRLGADASFGLASSDPAGRRAAVQWCLEVRRQIDQLDQVRGRASVAAVEVHSAPGRGRASAQALARSLDELQLGAWGSTRLVVEHCDCWRDDLPVQKGFLSLDEEISAADESGCLVAVNWGRSGLEARDPDVALRHVQQAAAAGVLGGLMLSGAGQATERSQPWEDAHLGHHDDEPASLMGSEQVTACLEAARTSPALLYLGAKITAPATASVDERLARLDRLLAQITPDTATIPATAPVVA